MYMVNNEVEWEEVAPGMKRKIMAHDERLMLVKVEFEKKWSGCTTPASAYTDHVCRAWAL